MLIVQSNDMTDCQGGIGISELQYGSMCVMLA